VGLPPAASLFVGYRGLLFCGGLDLGDDVDALGRGVVLEGGGGHVDTKAVDAVDDGAVRADGVFGDAACELLVVGERGEVHVGGGVEGKVGVALVVGVHGVGGGEGKVGGGGVRVHEPGLAADGVAAAEAGGEAVVGVGAGDEDGLGAGGGRGGGAGDRVAAAGPARRAGLGGAGGGAGAGPGSAGGGRVAGEGEAGGRVGLVAHGRVEGGQRRVEAGGRVVGGEGDVEDVVGARVGRGEGGEVVVEVVGGGELAEGVVDVCAVHGVFGEKGHGLRLVALHLYACPSSPTAPSPGSQIHRHPNLRPLPRTPPPFTWRPAHRHRLSLPGPSLVCASRDRGWAARAMGGGRGEATAGQGVAWRGGQGAVQRREGKGSRTKGRCACSLPVLYIRVQAVLTSRRRVD
jgi:hypothetical protein